MAVLFEMTEVELTKANYIAVVRFSDSTVAATFRVTVPRRERGTGQHPGTSLHSLEKQARKEIASFCRVLTKSLGA
jgi:hypothetical protein